MLKNKVVVIYFILVFCLGACQPISIQTTVAAEGQKIIGYYPAWAAARGVLLKDVPYSKLTHINYAFSNVSEDGECILGDAEADSGRVYTADESISGRDDKKSAEFHGNFNQLLELKKQFPELKVLISIGGWNWSGNFSKAAKDTASRQRFASSCIDLYLNKYPGVFDGLDIDWEYPVSGGLSSGIPEDKANFTLLLGELRSQLNSLGETNKRTYLLTIAAPIGPGTLRNLDLAGIAAAVDWINLMTYDFHGTWDTTTNFNAPLFRTADDPADASLNIDAAVLTYLAEGVPASKLVLGVPFYGRGWSGVANVDHGLYQPAQGAAPGTYEAGSFEYKDIRDRYLPAWHYYWNDEANVPWLYDEASQTFISFDDARSIEAKAGYAKDLGLAGVMIWDISQGGEQLMEAIYNGFKNGGPEKPTMMPTVIVPRPFEAEIPSVNGIIIDGKLEDWPEVPDFALNDASQIVYAAASNSWNGPADLSTDAWVGWCAEGLYFAFRVLDDVHVQSAADDTLWHGDHMEIQLDTQIDIDYDNPGMNDDDFQIGISIGDFDQVSPMAYAWFNGANLAGEIEKAQIAYLSSNDGYVLEIFLPKETLSGVSLTEGSTIGMNISPSDSDSAAQGQEVMLSTSTIRTYADPRTFGKLTLGK